MVGSNPSEAELSDCCVFCGFVPHGRKEPRRIVKGVNETSFVGVEDVKEEDWKSKGQSFGMGGSFGKMFVEGLARYIAAFL